MYIYILGGQKEKKKIQRIFICLTYIYSVLKDIIQIIKDIYICLIV